MPLESCQKYTATLSEILALTPVVQTIADATDVPGVRLEWLNGAWYGDCGFPSAAQHSALLAANAYNSLGVGSRATLPSGLVTWRGAVGGWVESVDASMPSGIVHFVGDSITTRNNGMSWAHQLIALSKGRLVCGSDNAVGGHTITDALEIQVPKLATAVRGSEVWVQLGTNSEFGNDVSLEIAEYNKLLDAVSVAQPSAKIRVFGIPPSRWSLAINGYTYKMNIAIESMCLSRGIAYHYGWSKSVDPATGWLSSALSIDETHPNLQAHNDCANALILDILGNTPSGYVIPFTGSDVDSASLLTWGGGLLVSDPNSDNIPATFNNYTAATASATAELSVQSAPLFGKVFKRSIVAGSAAILDRITGLTFAAGATYEIGFYFKQVTSGVEAGSRISLNATPAYYIFNYSGWGGFDIEGYYRCIVTQADIGATAVSFNKSILASTYPKTCSHSIGMLYIRRIK